jgi:predicted MFS family arabinose efflux permease
MRRPTVLALFAAIFVAELGWAGISPLLPSFQHRYGLTDVATGLIVSLASVGILLVSVPASGLANRIAVRTLTLWSLGVLAVGDLIVGVSGSYSTLLAGRIVFGIGLGMIWVTATTWLHEAAGKDGSRALSLTTSIVGMGTLIGPTFTGWLGERFTLGTPFIMLAGVTALVLIVLLFLRSPTGNVPESNPPLGEMLRAARIEPLMIAALVVTLSVALMWMSAELLVPLRLHDAGFGASRIGFAFSAASVVFLVASAVTSARAERYATVRISAAWTVAFALTIFVAVAGVGATSTIAFLAAAGLTTGVLVALSYPLGAAGAAHGGFSVAVVGALINVVWAGSGLLGPIVGGLVAENVDDRVWFLGLAVCGFAAAAWMWKAAARTPARDRADAVALGAPGGPNP